MRAFLFISIWNKLSRTSLNSFSQAVHSLVDVHVSPMLKGLSMALAPLRRVVLREIEVFKFHRDRPEQFVIVDRLECGHSYTDFQWSFLDLLNPYSETAGKKRHRCRECAAIIRKKESQSVKSWYWSERRG